MAVEQILSDQKIEIVHIQLGEVTIVGNLNNTQLAIIKQRLEHIGFELLDDEHQQIIEKIKSTVIRTVQQPMSEHTVFSDILANELHKDYSLLSKLFSTTEGITIEQFIIQQKIEKAKELLTYNQSTLSEIAFRMGYSSVAHLSSQFKKVTGMTPSKFKEQGTGNRKNIDNLS